MAVPTNDDELMVWLEDQSQPIHVTIATRASLRAFPVAITAAVSSSEYDKFALLTGRCLLNCSIASIFKESEISDKLKETARITSRSIDLVQSDVSNHQEIKDTARSAAYAARVLTSDSPFHLEHTIDACLCANRVVNDTATFAEEAKTTGWAAIYSDCSEATARLPESCFATGLWSHQNMPWKLRKTSLSLLTETPTSGSNWSFWRNWYEGFLNGEPLDWELQKSVALIPDDVWKAGVEAVAAEIEGIQKPFEIREQIIELKSQLALIEEPVAGIGHNNPPEAIETASPIQATTIIWAELEELEKLTEEERPDRDQLKEISARLRAISHRVGAFVKDVTYDNLKTGTSDVVKMSGAAWIATNGPAIKDLLVLVSTTIDEWLAYLILAP